MAALSNPGMAGPVPFDTLIYASASLNYGGVPALAQYKIYDTPDPAYVTPRINLSAFANLASRCFTEPSGDALISLSSSVIDCA